VSSTVLRSTALRGTVLIDRTVAERKTAAEKAIELKFDAATADNPDHRPRRT